jgi:hypothetical protein
LYRREELVHAVTTLWALTGNDGAHPAPRHEEAATYSRLSFAPIRQPSFVHESAQRFREWCRCPKHIDRQKCGVLLRFRREQLDKLGDRVIAGHARRGGGRGCGSTTGAARYSRARPSVRLDGNQ